MTKTPYAWTLRIKVDPSWVADGFDLSDPDQLAEIKESLIPYARDGEVKVVVLSAPERGRIMREQGFPDAEIVKARSAPAR